MNRRERERRFDRLRSIGCLACRQDGQYSYPEIHHINLDGKAGQVRLGDGYTVGLCAWHHRGEPLFGTAAMTEKLMGPSRARRPRAFRERFGTDQALLQRANELIEAYERERKSQPPSREGQG